MFFDELALSDEVLDALWDMHFDECTPVQEKAIPVILDRRDVIACAQTGTGKTAAYILPLLTNLAFDDHDPDKLNAIIISGALNLGNSRLEFVLSTIETPKSMLPQWQAKVAGKMKFIGMGRWTMEECEQLAAMITQMTNLQWSEDYPPQKFIEKVNFSPAQIKTILNNLISIGVNQVDDDVVEMIMMY